MQPPAPNTLQIIFIDGEILIFNEYGKTAATCLGDRQMLFAPQNNQQFVEVGDGPQQHVVNRNAIKRFLAHRV